MAQTLLHACLRVRDLEASKKFYTELFDFEVARERDYPEDKFSLSFLKAPGSDFEIELTYNYQADPYEIGNGFSHLALGVDDLDAVYQACKESGYKVSEMKALSNPYFFVTDPDGYRLEVMANSKKA
ncbi:VOC family protein [Ignavigranum ruoffiae]|uniref:lactoylglutathione lyase n=1 Tax=Ignavigranum ruoffiae TaxID=89093 RepID=UPI002352EDA6|nr:VOC family protein [Ignavigranum ruoffiae]